MEKKPNIKKVAALAGVSISTVSRVLNHSASVSDELRNKVFRAINDTGYSINPIASTLKSTRRNQIAIVIPSLRQTYYTDIIKGISDYCYEKGVLPVILESSGELEKEQKIIGDLEKHWVDGIILIPGKNESKPGCREFAHSLSSLSKNQENIPVVLLEANGLNPELDYVRVDYSYAFHVLTSHLLEIGRRKIVYMSSPAEAAMYEMSLAGVCEALHKAGCELPKEYLIDGGFTVLEGYQAMKKILDQKIEIEGVVCANDQMASGALWACCERGICVPKDIAIAGFGGVALSIVTTPSITTMIVPRYDLGAQGAQLLFDRIAGEQMQVRKLELKPYLAIRGSTLKTAAKTMDIMFGE